MRFIRRRKSAFRLLRLEDRVTPATFTVTTTADSGAGSLRSVIGLANNPIQNPGHDFIQFDSTVFATAKTITLTGTELLISDDLTITGPPVAVTINGNNASRVFDLAASGTFAVSMTHLIIANGRVAGAGAGILSNAENLTLTDCTITTNTTTGANSGGGISGPGGATLSLTRCTVSSNTAGGNGGGIDANGSASVTLTDCAIQSNKATSQGGGVGVGSSSLKFERCTLSGNSATNGGGLYFAGAIGAGGLTLLNSTFSADTASASGGGAALSNVSGTLVVQNSTLTLNSAVSQGGAIARLGGSASINIESSIVQGNSAAIGPEVYTTGTVTAKTSAFKTTTGISNFSNLGGNLINQSILLGSLLSNGGLTKTHLPGAGSPLINNGSNPAGRTTDQRGNGYFRSMGGPDIGAAEVQSYVVTNINDSGNGSLRQSLIETNSRAGADSITFEPNVFASPQTITLTSGQLSISDSTTIAGPTGGVTISGNKSSRIFAVSSTFTLSDMVITDGAGGSGGGGIAIGSSVTVTLSRVTVANCTAADGAGIQMSIGVFGGQLNLNGCMVTGNTTLGGTGGGIDAEMVGTMSFQNCTFAGNSANLGGGIAIRNGVATLDDCTISGNNSNSSGGGIFTLRQAYPLQLRLRNCTVSSNTASSTGGGISASGNANEGGLVVQSSTITGNAAGSVGGGIQYLGTAILLVQSSIVSGNSASGGGADVSSAAAVAAYFSAIGVGTGFTLSGTSSNNLAYGAVLKLGPLTDNGGSTKTLLPAMDSPLVNTGSNPTGVSVDQRGPGYPRIRGGAPDIGAVEVALPLIVTNTADGGPGTLRQAIQDANNAAGPDLISFDPATFGSAQSIALTSGGMTITDSVTIVGPGSTLAKVSGGNGDRVITINAAAAASVTISGLTLTGGNTTGPGGAILLQDESVTVNGCVVTGNTAQSGGGGIAVANGGSLTLFGCTVSNNTGLDPDGDGSQFNSDGGGIFFANGGSLLVENSTISGNQATGNDGKGGGLYFVGAAGAAGVVLRNSTLTGNSGGICSGGIGLANFNDTLSILNSTIVANSAAIAPGGGIELISGTGTIAVTSSIVSGNIAVSSPDIRSSQTVNVNNSAIGSTQGFTLSGANNLVGQNLKLGSLGNTGGPTQTIALLAGSPCIDHGANPANLTTDQRGAGFARVIGIAADIGAFEFAPPPRVQSIAVISGSAQRSRVTSVQVNFDALVTLPAMPEGAFQLKRQSDGALVGLAAAVTNTSTTSVTLTFTGNNTDFGSLQDGRYTLTVFAGSVLDNGGQLDGNGDGTGGDDYTLIGTPANGLFRLFGDADGNGTVNAADFLAFRSAFGGTSATFDFNNNGSVDINDFLAFRSRFGSSI